MKVMFLGDVHGNKRWLKAKFYEAAKRGCEAIVQLGDLGYGFPLSQENELHMADWLNKKANKAGVDFYFIDGNHDNHPEIRADSVPFGSIASIRGYDRVFYIPRGAKFTRWGTTFLGLGGAYSIDKQRRLVYEAKQNKKVWWPTEMITLDEKERAIENAKGGVDIMLTHDAPWHVIDTLFHTTRGVKDDPESAMNQQIIKDVMLEAMPKLLIHGHWHYRYNQLFPVPFTDEYIKVVGLGRDGDRESGAVILTLPDDIEGSWG